MSAKLKSLGSDLADKQTLLKGLTGSYLDVVTKTTSGTTKTLKSLSDMTVGELQDRLKTLNASLETLVPKSEAYKKVIQDINDTEKLLNQTKSDKNQAATVSKNKKATDQLFLQQKQLTDQVNKLNDEQAANTLSTYDKELAAASAKYNDLIKQEQDYQLKIKASKDLSPAQKKDAINKSNDQIGSIDTDKENDLNVLRVKQARDTSDAITKFQDDQAVNFTGNLDKEIVKINDFYDQQKKKLASGDLDGQMNVEINRIVSTAQATAAAKLINEKKFQDELQQLRDEYAGVTNNKELSEAAKIQAKYDKELAIFKDQLNQKLITQEQYNEAIDQLNKNKQAETDKDSEKKRSDEEEFAIQTAEKVSNQIFSISSKNRQAETNAQIKNLEAQKDTELNNKNLTAAQKQDIEDKYAQKEAAIKLKAWKADQQAAIKEAIINGALAVGKALAQVGPLGAFVIPGIIAETAVQVVTISSQKPPEFAKGGLIVDGPSHPNGGVDLVNTQTGQAIANVEGGEALMVLSKQTTANNGMLIKELLYNSQYRNGAPVSINTDLATTSATSHYRNGGAIPAPSTSLASATGSAGGSSGNAELIDEIRLMRKRFDDFSKKPWEFNDRAYQDYKNKKQVIMDRATT